MYSIDLMIEEHKNILAVIKVMRTVCCGILEGKPIDEEDFRNLIYFARTYADRHHHGKEENILFRDMSEKLGNAAQTLIRHGMLVEHDLGRFYINELEKALNRYAQNPDTETKLDILARTAQWSDLLTRHIEKENEAVYPFAQRGLSKDVLQKIDKEVHLFEIKAEQAGIQKTNLHILRTLSEKYA